MAKRILYIECIKIKIAVSNNFMEIRIGGEGEGVFELGNPEGRGGSCSFGIPGGRRDEKTCLLSQGCEFFLE